MLDGTILDYFNIIGEDGCLKMVVTPLPQTMNDQCLDNLKHPAWKWPINSETTNIDQATFPKQSCASFCKAFGSVNSMTFICWPHNGNFNNNAEAFENKFLFVLLSDKKKSNGNYLGSQFVFVLFDSRSTTHQPRRFNATHATDMGIGLPQNLMQNIILLSDLALLLQKQGTSRVSSIIHVLK